MTVAQNRSDTIEVGIEEEVPMVAGRMLVVCKDDRSLEIVDLERGRSIGGVVSSGDRPHEVAASRDGTVGYVPVYSDAGVGAPGSDGRAIDIIDLVRARTMATVELPFASRRTCRFWDRTECST